MGVTHLMGAIDPYSKKYIKGFSSYSGVPNRRGGGGGGLNKRVRWGWDFPKIQYLARGVC